MTKKKSERACLVCGEKATTVSILAGDVCSICDKHEWNMLTIGGVNWTQAKRAFRSLIRRARR